MVRILFLGYQIDDEHLGSLSILVIHFASVFPGYFQLLSDIHFSISKYYYNICKHTMILLFKMYFDESFLGMYCS